MASLSRTIKIIWREQLKRGETAVTHRPNEAYLHFFHYIFIVPLISTTHDDHKSIHAVFTFWMDSTKNYCYYYYWFQWFWSLSARWCDVSEAFTPWRENTMTKSHHYESLHYFIAWKESRFNRALSVIRKMFTSIKIILINHFSWVFKGIDSVTSLIKQPRQWRRKKVNSRQNAIEYIENTMTQTSELTFLSVFSCFVNPSSSCLLSPVSWPPLRQAGRCDAGLSQWLWCCEVICAFSFSDHRAERKEKREIKAQRWGWRVYLLFLINVHYQEEEVTPS